MRGVIFMRPIDFSKSAVKQAEIISASANSMVIIFKKCGGSITLEGVPKTTLRYIVGSIEINEDHSLPLTLRFFKHGEEDESMHIRFILIPRVKTRMCFDLRCMDLCGNNICRTPGTLKQVTHGVRTDIMDVECIELGVKEVFHDVRVRFEDFYMTDEMPTEFPLPDIKLVDEFGQWKPKEWPGKIHSKEELSEAMRSNEGPSVYPFPEWNKWGGDSTRRLKKGTGFFSTCKTEDGRWHLVDPDGCDYFSHGPCCVRPGDMGRVDGVEKMLDWLPDMNDPSYRDFFHTGKTWGWEHDVTSFNYARANLYKVYGDKWEEKWKEITYRILMCNGINSQGTFSSLDINNGKSRIPYSMQLKGFPETKTFIYRDFPDVLSPEYHKNSVEFAKQLETWKDDPWLIGYFMRNEPGFNFITGISIANEALHNPEMTYCRIGLIEFLRGRYGTIDNLNMAWNSSFNSFAVFEKPFKNCIEEYPYSRQDLREYSLHLVREYCRIPAEACRAVDPNHLNLGLRWSKMNNPDMLAGWEYLDVFSFNCYSFEPLQDMNFVSDAGVDRPILIGEFHCGALDRGLPSTGLKGVKNQYERGIMWRQFVEKTAAHPFGVGAHWFQYNDQFCLGRPDGENYQIGIVDVCMQPYKELVDAAKSTARVLYKVRNGEMAPYDRMPEIIPMIG
jgi:hypothetical protein